MWDMIQPVPALLHNLKDTLHSLVHPPPPPPPPQEVGQVGGRFTYHHYLANLGLPKTRAPIGRLPSPQVGPGQRKSGGGEQEEGNEREIPFPGF